MLDFTSALYLGLRHPSGLLAPWDVLTLGRPAALEEPPDAAAVTGALARLQGCEAATALPSTLHLFWDLFRVLGRKRSVILCDAATYPIAKWGTERASGMGTPVHTFAHHDPAALGSIARRMARASLRPIVVADGYCPSCGRVAPIPAYADIARGSGGYLVLDDTQALGILGELPTRANPYGSGGGGSLRWHGTFGPHIVVGSSLAKGFGAPLAVLSGSRELIDRFRDRSETRIHCSPPSVAVIHAAHRAMQVNRRHGETSAPPAPRTRRQAQAAPGRDWAHTRGQPAVPGTVVLLAAFAACPDLAEAAAAWRNPGGVDERLPGVFSKPHVPGNSRTSCCRH